MFSHRAPQSLELHRNLMLQHPLQVTREDVESLSKPLNVHLYVGPHVKAEKPEASLQPIMRHSHDEPALPRGPIKNAKLLE